MEYFQTAWKDGSALNKGLTADEFFYNQIYGAIKTNVENKTLPFFDSQSSSLPIELSTGKIINDENLIALEQVAAKQGFKSNVWLFGEVLDKMQNEGISINLKRYSEPALCLTKYANPTHLNNELYVGDEGKKTKAQFLYNFDSLDDRSKEAVQKYFKKALLVGEDYSNENFKNYVENSKKSLSQKGQAFSNLREKILEISAQSSELCKKVSKSKENINFNPLINAQARHVCQTITGSKIENKKNPEMEQKCYEVLNGILSDTTEGKEWKVGQAITKALDGGTLYAKSYTSKDFNFEVRKNHEETNIKNEKLKAPKYKGYDGFGY